MELYFEYGPIRFSSLSRFSFDALYLQTEEDLCYGCIDFSILYIFISLVAVVWMLKMYVLFSGRSKTFEEEVNIPRS